MNPLAQYLCYVGIATAALGEPIAAGASFAAAVVAQMAPAFVSRDR